MTEYRLRILHISDLHERVALDGMDEGRKAAVRDQAAARYRVLEGSDFYQVLRERVAPVDLVCFTGDVADWGLAEEYTAATPRFDAILRAAGVARERLFLVPGNHDVQRPLAKTAWEQLRAALARADDISRFMAGVKPPFGFQAAWREEIGKRTAAFWQWVEGPLGRAELLPSHSPHRRLGYRVTVRLPALPFPVQLIGLDSAWLAGGDDDAKKLLLTRAQVDALAGAAGKTLDGFRLALLHHPLSSLADEDECFPLLADYVDLLLHGDKHRQGADERTDPDHRLKIYASGSLYDGDKGDRYVNGFQLLDIFLTAEGRPLRYELEFWGWSPRGHWYRSGANYLAAADSRLVEYTPLGEQAKTRAAADAYWQSAPQRVFIGREVELTALEQALLVEEARVKPCLVSAVQGMPGVGKSYLAEHFAALHRAQFPGGVVRLALAEHDGRDGDALYQALCAQLEVRTGGGDNPLRRRLLAPLTLLIIENVDDAARAAAVLALTYLLPHCRILITGRYLQVGEAQGWTPILVRPFTPNDAYWQFSEEFRAAVDEEEAREFHKLLATLGHLPLAIHIAAGHLRLPGRTCAGFLRELRRRDYHLAGDLERERRARDHRRHLRTIAEYAAGGTGRRGGAPAPRLLRLRARAALRRRAQPGRGHLRAGGR